MKRVAIIGCSHSDSDYIDRTTWSEWLALDFPNIQFDNYAVGGHSHVYMSTVLNFCLYIAEPYDAVIVQCSGLSRWEVGVLGTFRGIINTAYNKQTYAEAKAVFREQMFIDVKRRGPFPSPPNFTKKLPTWPRLQQWTPFKPDVVDAENTKAPVQFNQKSRTGEHLRVYRDSELEEYGPNTLRHKKALKQIQSSEEDGIMATMYSAKIFSLMFRAQLENLAMTNPVYWFSTFNMMGNNLGYPQKENAFAWCGERLGADVLYDEYMDDTLHLNHKGHRWFVDNYIMPSELGKKIIDLSNN